MLPEFLKSPVESQAASDFHLYTALIFLTLTFISIIWQYARLVRKIRENYTIFKVPFVYFVAIFTGLLLVIANELVILISIIYSDQLYTYLGREKAIFIVMGLGFFIFGWTQIVLFNLSLKPRVNRAIRTAFLGAMSFYVFAVIMTILITFEVVSTHDFVGLGYETAVGIYGTFLLIDIIVLFYIALVKRKQSKYQAWVGLLLFISLFLNFLSIVFNALPLIIVNTVDPSIHVIFNYVVEPAVYFVTDTLSLLFLTWVLFNPEWLKNRSIEQDS